MTAGGDDAQERFIVENEFARVLVERLDGNSGIRLRVTDMRSGAWITLDALELESLVWIEHRALDPVLDPNRTRWIGEEPKSQ